MAILFKPPAISGADTKTYGSSFDPEEERRKKREEAARKAAEKVVEEKKAQDFQKSMEMTSYGAGTVKPMKPIISAPPDVPRAQEDAALAQASLDTFGGKEVLTEKARRYNDLQEKYSQTREKLDNYDKSFVLKPPEEIAQKQKQVLADSLYEIEKNYHQTTGEMTAEDFDSIARNRRFGQQASEIIEKPAREKKFKALEDHPYLTTLQETFVGQPGKAIASVFEAAPSIIKRSEMKKFGRSPEEQASITQARERAAAPMTTAGRVSEVASAIGKFGVEAELTIAALNLSPFTSRIVNFGTPVRVGAGTLSSTPTITQMGVRGATIFGAREAGVQTIVGEGYDPKKIAHEATLGAFFDAVAVPAIKGTWKMMTKTKVGEAVFTIKPEKLSFDQVTGNVGMKVPKDVQEVFMKISNDVKGVGRKLVYAMDDGRVNEMRITPDVNGNLVIQVNKFAPNWLMQRARDIVDQWGGKSLKNTVKVTPEEDAPLSSFSPQGVKDAKTMDILVKQGSTPEQAAKTINTLSTVTNEAAKHPTFDSFYNAMNGKSFEVPIDSLGLPKGITKESFLKKFSTYPAPKSEGEALQVVMQNGVLTVDDGVHRMASALRRGETKIQVKFQYDRRSLKTVYDLAHTGVPIEPPVAPVSPMIVDIPERPVPSTSEPMTTVGVMKAKDFLGGEMQRRQSPIANPENFINAQEAINITRKYFKDTEVPVEIVERLITPEGERALGKYREGMITFVENPHESTPDHEAVHAYLDLFAGKDVKDSILQDVIDSGKASNRMDAEEQIADGFVEYVRTGQGRGFTRRVIEYFKDMWAKLKGFFKKPDQVRQLYRDIILKRRSSTIEPGKTVSKDVAALQNEIYQTPEALTLKFLKGITKPEIGQQEIRDLLRSPNVKQAEREVMESVLAGFGDQQKINVNDLRTAVQQELLPLTPVVSSTNPENSLKKPSYEGTTIPENMRGDIGEYMEHVYESPIVHDLSNHMSNPAYFAHTRLEDLASSETDDVVAYNTGKIAEKVDSGVRRVIEIQSDLFQKNEVMDILVGRGEKSVKNEIELAESFVEKTHQAVNEYKAAIASLDKLPKSATVSQYKDLIADEDFVSVQYDIKQALEGAGRKKGDPENKGFSFQDIDAVVLSIDDVRENLSGNLAVQEKELADSIKNLGIKKPLLQQKLEAQRTKETRLMGKEFTEIAEKFDVAKRDVQRWADHMTDLPNRISNAKREMVESGSAPIRERAKNSVKKLEDELKTSEYALKNSEEDYAKLEAQLKAIKEKQRKAMTAHEKGIMDYRQRWFERIVKEEIRYAALDGKQLIQFPTGKTAALVEGFLSSEGAISEDNRNVGDEVEYQGMDMVVVEGGYAAETVTLVPKKDVIWSGSIREWQEGNLDSEIEYAKDSPSDALGIDTLETFAEDQGYTFESKEGQASITDPKAEKKPSTISMMKDGEEVAQISGDKYDANRWDEIVKVMEKDGVDVETWLDNEIEKWAQSSVENQDPADMYGKDQVYQDGDNIVIVEEKANLEYASVGEGSQYDTVDPRNMDQDYQQAIVDFYDKQVAGFLQKYRKGNIEQIVDAQGVEWWQTKITPDDRGAVEAYQRDVFSEPEKPKKFMVPEKGVDPKDKKDPNFEARNSAQQYAKKAGLPPIQENKFALANPDVAKKIAKIFDEAKSTPDDPAVKASYEALKKETAAQFNHLPVKVEWWTKEGQPYANSREMMEDVKRGVLKVFKGGDPHPLLSEVWKDGITYNDAFRAIHDYYGHAANGNTFGANGEENAWIKHSQMFSDLARKAMTTETRGQNSWVNFGKNSHLPPSERPYAEQKVFLLPDEFTKRSDLVKMEPSAEPKPFTAKDFHDSVRETVQKYKMTEYTPEEYEGMDVRRNVTGTAGYAITNEGEIVSVFNYGTKGAGRFGVVDAIENGGTIVTAYAGKVSDMYEHMGFELMERRENFTKGEADVVSMLLNPKKYLNFKSSNPQLYGSTDAEAVFTGRDGIVSGGDRSAPRGGGKQAVRKKQEGKTGVKAKQKMVTVERLDRMKEQMKLTSIRRGKVSVIRHHFGLSDASLRAIGGKADVRFMTDKEFNTFLNNMQAMAAIESKRFNRMNEVISIIKEKELRKTDNLREALELPPLSQMTVAQLDIMEEALSGAQFGDTFLTRRQLETIKNTDMAGVKTVREVKDSLAKLTGTDPDKLNVNVTWFDRFRYDTALAERNPFYRIMVDETNRAMYTTEAETIATQRETNKLFKAARKSRQQGVVGKLVPQDTLVFQYLEATDKEKVAVQMTSQELEAAQFVQKEYAKMRDYLVENEMLEKYRENYMTHLRRGFFETWKDDGFVGAVKGMFQQAKEDKANFNILSDTGEILPLEKFFQFSLRRTGKLVPTKNVAKAFLVYKRTFEKKRALDSIMPKLDTYVSVLTPTKMTPRGLEFDRSLKRFYNEWMNNKKGRRTDFGGFLPQGGTLDIALRGIRAFTTILDIGLSLPVGIATNVGEQTMNFTMLGAKNYALGTKRMRTKEGKAILQKYENYIGRSIFDELFDASAGIGDQAMTVLFSLFKFSQLTANKQFLLGSLTEAEMKAGVVEPHRLAEFKSEMGRWRVVEQSKSVFGSTSAAGAVMQYKGWAVPIVRTSIKNLSEILKDPKRLKSKEGREMLRVGMVTALFGLLSLSLLAQDEDSFIGRTLGKVIREGLSLLGAFDPDIWVGTPRMLQFLQDLVRNLKQLVTLEEYKTSKKGQYKKGDLKALKSLPRQFTPKLIKQFMPSTTTKKATAPL